MLTQLYTIEENPALCSIIWGGNFSATPIVNENDSSAITAASTSQNVAALSGINGVESGGGGVSAAGGSGAGSGTGGIIVADGGYRNDVNAAVAAGAVGVIGDNLRDDLYITNEVSAKHKNEIHSMSVFA